MTPTPAKVTITPAQFYFAARVGLDRSVQNIRKSARPRYGADPYTGRYDHSIQGALAEFIVAKYTGRFWDGSLGAYHAADVGRLQVRSSPRDDASLCLHPADADEEAFVLVTGAAYTWTIHGWTYARDGKRPDYWGDPTGRNRPAFWVPQHDLRPLADLPAPQGA